MLAKLRVIWLHHVDNSLHLRRWEYRSIFIQIFTVSSERRSSVWNYVHYDLSRSSKVVNFGTNQNRVWDLLLVLSSNFGHLLPLLELLYAESHLFRTPPL